MQSWRAVFALPRDCWTLSAASFVNRTGSMVVTFLVLFCERELGLSKGEAGWMYVLCGAAGVAASPFAGRMSDAFGPATMIRASLLGSGVALLLTPLLSGVYAVGCMLFAFSALNEAMRPATLAAIATAAPPEMRRTAFALQRTAVNAGMAVGSLLGGYVADRSLDGLFYIDGATSLLALVLLAFVPFRTLGRPSVEADAPRPPVLPVDVLRDRRLTWLLIALFPSLVAFFQILGPLAAFVEGDLARSQETTGFLFFVNTALIVVVEVPFNSKTSLWRPSRALCVGALLYGLGFGGYAFARGEAALVATTIVWTFGEMILFPAASDRVAKIAPPERRGAYMGWLTMSFGLAFMVGPAIGLRVLEAFGAEVLWLGAGVACAVSAAALFAAARAAR